MNEIFLFCLFGKPIVFSFYQLLVYIEFKGYVKVLNNELCQIDRDIILKVRNENFVTSAWSTNINA